MILNVRIFSNQPSLNIRFVCQISPAYYHNLSLYNIIFESKYELNIWEKLLQT